MKHWMKTLSCWMVCSALWMPAAHAQKKLEDAPVMERVVVTAGRVAEPEKAIPTSVTVIDREAISASPAKDLGELMAEQGFAVRSYPGNLTSVSIRGFRTETLGNDLGGHVLILLNGRRAGTGNAAKLLTRNIERIEIIRGPASVQYGSAAMGGIVNVITRKGEGRPSAWVEGTLGSREEQKAGFGLSGASGPFDFSGSLSYETRDDYKTGDGDRFRNTGMGDVVGASLNAGWTFSPKNRFGVIYSGFEVDGQGSPDYFTANDLDDETDRSNHSVDVIYDGAVPDDTLSWKARYFRGRDRDKWMDPVESNPDGWDDGIADKVTTDNQGLQAQGTFSSGPYRLTAGMDWAAYDIDATWTPQETEYDNLAGFVLARGQFLDDRLTLSAGGRYDTFEVAVEKPSGRTEDDTHFSPSVGAAWQALAWLKLRLNYAEAFMMPQASQLAADYVTYGTPYVGNPDLDPETSRTWEGGVDLQAGSARASLTFFYTDFSDKIEQTTLADGSQSWKNLGNATLAGIESEFSMDVGAFFDWPVEVRPYAGFTYLPRYEDEETGDVLLYTPDWTGSLGIAIVDPENGLTARLNASLTGDQTVEDWQSGLYPVPEVTLDGYTLFDFTVEKSLFKQESGSGLTLKGGIRNLFDEAYETVIGFPMPGRSFYAGVRYDF